MEVGVTDAGYRLTEDWDSLSGRGPKHRNCKGAEVRVDVTDSRRDQDPAFVCSGDARFNRRGAGGLPAAQLPSAVSVLLKNLVNLEPNDQHGDEPLYHHADPSHVTQARSEERSGFLPKAGFLPKD